MFPDRVRDGVLRHRGLDTRRLRLIGVVLPVAFVVVLEYARATASGTEELSVFERLSLVGLTVLCITGFAMAMFHFIDRAQREVLRQNRELAALNAVSTAVRGQVRVEDLLDDALDAIVASGLAAEVSVVVGTDADVAEGTRVRRRTTSAAPDAPTGQARAGSVIEIPLTTGTRVVGRMQLTLCAEAGRPDTVTPSTLETLGRQLACAVELAEVVSDLERVNREGAAFQDVLLGISNQRPSGDVLASVARHARDFLGADDAVLCLSESATGIVRRERPSAVADDRPQIVFDRDGASLVHEHHAVCPVRSSSRLSSALTVPLRGSAGDFGDLWVARVTAEPFTARDEAYLRTLCELAAIALTGAEQRETGRQGAIVAERERIAREMHDSLAQVLGVTHLRLRAVDGREEVRAAPEVATELAALADICEEAYHDVREAILGLRHSCRAERGLLDSMSAYLAKYSDQCGIETTLVTELEHELALSPSCEVQMIRVIQEALTNVRKHSGARSAVVRITESDSTTTFVVEDDGYGFDPGGSPAQRDRFGLFTMRERMGLLNGSLVIDSAPGHGTRVIAGVPERSIRRPISP